MLLSDVLGGNFSHGFWSAGFAAALRANWRGATEASSTAGNKVALNDVEKMQVEIDELLANKTLNTDKIFYNPDEAAKEVLNITAPISEKYGLKVGGNIIRIRKDRYSYTKPIIGGQGSVSVPTHNIGYHTHPGGPLIFSNRTNNFSQNINGGDPTWISVAKQPLYVGVNVSGSVRIGVCNPENYSHIGRFGTSPSRVIQ